MVRMKEEEDVKDDDELKEYNLDTYDDDSAEDEDKTTGWHTSAGIMLNKPRFRNILQCKRTFILRK